MHFRLAPYACALALACACNQAPSDQAGSEVKDMGQPVSSMQLNASLDASNAVLIAATDATNTVTKVTDLKAAAQITQAAPMASTSFLDIGSLNLQSLSFEVNGISQCTKDFASNVTSCSNPSVAEDSQPPAPAPAPETFQASDYKAKVTMHDGMSCGNHLSNGQVWQKSFDVGIEATAAALDAIDHVVHDVWYQYANNPYSISTRDNAFATNVGFLTPVTHWSLGKSKVFLKSGTSFELAAGVVDWLDNDPARKARDACNE